MKQLSIKFLSMVVITAALLPAVPSKAQEVGDQKDPLRPPAEQMTGNYLCEVLIELEVRLSDTPPVEMSIESKDWRERKEKEFFLLRRTDDKDVLLVTRFEIWNDKKWETFNVNALPQDLLGSRIMSFASEIAWGSSLLVDFDQKAKNLLVRQRIRSVWIVDRTYTAECKPTFALTETEALQEILAFD